MCTLHQFVQKLQECSVLNDLSEAGGKPKLYYGYVIVVATFIIITVVFGVIFNFGLFLGPMLNEYGWSRAETSAAYSLVFFIYALLGIFAGRLNDRFGPRIIMTVSSIFLGAGFLLMPLITAIWQFYLFYGIIVGIGAGGCFVPLVSTVSRWFIKRRGLMTGIVVSGAGIGGIIMPPLVTLLISTQGWRTAYIVLGTLILAVTMVAGQLLRRDPSQKGLLPYGGSAIRHDVSIADIGGIPLRQAVRTRQFWIVGVLFFCVGFSVHATIVHIVIHATGMGISLSSAAIILVVINALNTFGRLLIGGFSDRIGCRKGLLVIFIGLSLAFLWLPFARELGALLLFAVLFGFSYGGLVSLMAPTAAQLFGLRSHGAILGLHTFFFSGFGAIGPILAGRVYDINGSYQVAFIIFAGLSIAGLILVPFLKPVKERA